MSFPYFVPSVINTNPVSAIPIGSFVTSVTPTISEISVSVTRDDLPLKTEKVSVTGLPTTNYYLPTSLYYVADPITYSYPVYKNVSYLDINSDKELHKKVTRHFFSRLYNRYIPDSEARLLNFVKLTAKDIELVKSLNEAKNITTKDDEYGEKLNYLADYIFTKKDVYNVLWHFSERTNIKWWDLKHYDEQIEDMLVKAVEEKIKDMIAE